MPTDLFQHLVQLSKKQELLTETEATLSQVLHPNTDDEGNVTSIDIGFPPSSCIKISPNSIHIVGNITFQNTGINQLKPYYFLDIAKLIDMTFRERTLSSPSPSPSPTP